MRKRGVVSFGNPVTFDCEWCGRTTTKGGGGYFCSDICTGQVRSFLRWILFEGTIGYFEWAHIHYYWRCYTGREGVPV